MCLPNVFCFKTNKITIESKLKKYKNNNKDDDINDNNGSGVSLAIRRAYASGLVVFNVLRDVNS